MSCKSFAAGMYSVYTPLDVAKAYASWVNRSTSIPFDRYMDTYLFIDLLTVLLTHSSPSPDTVNEVSA